MESLSPTAAPEAVSDFRTEGVVFVPEAVSTDNLRPVQERLRKIVRGRFQRFIDGDASGEVPEVNDPSHSDDIDAMLLKLRELTPQHQSFIYDVGRITSEFWRMMTSEDLVTIVKDCFDLPDQAGVGLSDVQFRVDGPVEEWDETLPWHQDYPYIPLVTEGCTLVVWIPLFDCPLELGPPQLIPGTHKWGPLEHTDVLSANGRRKVHKIPPEFESKADQMPYVQQPLRAGDALVFDICTAHRSGVNTSGDRVRWTATCRYNDVDSARYLPQYLPDSAA